MPRICFARFLIILLLIAAVSAPSAWGAPLRLSGGTPSGDILTRAWSTVVALWAKGGCIIDPHGLCVMIPLPRSTKAVESILMVPAQRFRVGL